uniref:Uncharacterized protein n=1 Tax=Anguilla anguilla TaxID=7936 RepID=A0A0E9RGU5_ANGAN
MFAKGNLTTLLTLRMGLNNLWNKYSLFFLNC